MRARLLFFIIIMSYSALAQWPKLFGHDSFDMVGRSIHMSYDQGSYITGAERISSGADLQGYVIKTDINGNTLWKRYFENQFGSNVLGLSSYPNGSILISGELWHSYYQDRNGFYAKINSCGEKEWCKIIDEPGESYCSENLLLPDDGCIVLGEINTNSYNRIWLYRIDSQGGLIWKKTLIPDTSYFNETGYNLILTIDACILVTGFTISVREPNLGWSTPFWFKMDLNGIEQWTLPWIRTTHNVGDFGRTRQDCSGNFYSGGSYGTTSKKDACLYKFTNSGDTLKHVIIINDGEGSIIKALEFYQDSTLFLGGAWGIGSNGYSKVLKCDTTGNIIKSVDIPLEGMPINYSALSQDNKIFGLSERPTYSENPHWETCLFKFNQNLEYDSIYSVPRIYDSLCPGSITPELTLNLDCEVVSTEEPERITENTLLQIYPNPSSSMVTVSIPDYFIVESKTGQFKVITTFYHLNGEKRIEIIDVNGRIVSTSELQEQQSSIYLDISTLTNGMYLARLINSGKIWAQGKMIKY